MPRYVIAGAVAAAVAALSPAVAHAQDRAAVAAPVADEPVAHDREIGARLGVATGGRVTTGGVRVAGLFLYQLSDIDWFQGTAAFGFGGQDASCFRDRDDDFLCDHAALKGFSAEITGGIRRWLRPHDTIVPFVYGTLGGRFISFRDDAVRGFAIPLTVGFGLRAKVHDLVSVAGDVAFDAGIAFMNKGVGVEPQLGLHVLAGVEIRLD